MTNKTSQPNANIRHRTCTDAKSFDAKYFREKAALCLRLADGLSLNNPGRFQLMDIAEDLQALFAFFARS